MEIEKLSREKLIGEIYRLRKIDGDNLTSFYVFLLRNFECRPDVVNIYENSYKVIYEKINLEQIHSLCKLCLLINETINVNFPRFTTSNIHLNITHIGHSVHRVKVCFREIISYNKLLNEI